MGLDFFLLSSILILFLYVAGYGCCPQLSYILSLLYRSSHVL